MEARINTRRRFLGRLTAVLGGLVAVPLLGGVAEAGRSTWRRRWGGFGWGRPGYGYGYGWGYPSRRWTTRRPYYYGGGYPGGPLFYNRGYYAPPPLVPVTPYYGPAPGFQFRYYRGYVPMLKNTPGPLPDPLALLEA